MGAGEFRGRVRAADSNGPHAAAACGLDAERRVFEDDAAGGRHADAARGFEEDGGLGFAGQAFVPADDGDRRRCARCRFDSTKSMLCLSPAVPTAIFRPRAAAARRREKPATSRKSRAEEGAVDRFLLVHVSGLRLGGCRRPGARGMHSTPLRPVVRRRISGTGRCRGGGGANSTQALACQGMESTMVPSMSKIRASALCVAPCIRPLVSARPR